MEKKDFLHCYIKGKATGKAEILKDHQCIYFLAHHRIKQHDALQLNYRNNLQEFRSTNYFFKKVYSYIIRAVKKKHISQNTEK